VRERFAPALIVAIVLLLRLPFLNQAIQGDDPYYLFGAQHALIDPAHPSHAKYVFQGELVDMRGHPHPPLNSWILAGLILLFGDVYEVPFHAAYLLFSVIAALSMWSLARRFSPDPVGATLLFIAVPAFLISGNTLEADLPFLAFWIAGIALFTAERYVFSAFALMLAAMTAYQAVAATPVLWVWCWLHARRSKAAWTAALTPVVVVGAYQIYERVTGGALPATVLAGYFQTYGLQQMARKLRNAAALTAHAGWLVFPVAAAAAFSSRWVVGVAAAVAGAFIDPNPLFWGSFAVGAMAIASCVRKPDFLTAWVVLFFAASLILFFAGAARYLLPMAAPFVLLVSQQLRPRYIRVAAAANLVLSLALAFVNYQHWNGYRDFALGIDMSRRVWVNGEWGLRFYTESQGALPLTRNQVMNAGDLVVSSALGFPTPVTAPLTLVREQEIRPVLPLRLLGLNAHSGYSTEAFGLRPFDIGTGPVDRVRTEVVMPREAKLSWLPMSAPEAGQQIVSGVYQLEGENRWMSGRAVILLKRASQPMPLQVQLWVPPQSHARTLTLTLDGREVLRQALPGPGIHTLATAPVAGSSLVIELDQTFRVPGDSRDLGVLLMAVGFR
jgi:hypothetical protein